MKFAVCGESQRRKTFHEMNDRVLIIFRDNIETARIASDLQLIKFNYQRVDVRVEL